MLDSLCIADTELSSEMYELNNKSLAAENCVIVESPHSYLPNTNSEQLVSIPGAQFLCLNFDERCDTDRRDSLKLSLIDGTLLCEPLGGPGASWPKTCLLIPGSDIMFKFESDSQGGGGGSSNRQYWGYSCLVTGIKFGHYPKSLPLLDLLHTTSNVIGKSLRVLMVGTELTEEEKSHAKWLESPLFSRGGERDKEESEDLNTTKSDKNASTDSNSPIKNSLNINKPLKPTVGGKLKGSLSAKESKNLKVITNNLSLKSNDMASPLKSPKNWSPIVSHQKFLEEMANNVKGSKANALIENMKKQLSSHASDKLGGAVLNECTDLCVAALIKHLGLVEIARKMANQHEITNTPMNVKDQWNEKILFVFKLGHKLRQWVITERQSNVQILEERKTRAKETGEEIAVDEEKEMEKRTTYQGICNEMIEKCRYLLQTKAYCAMYDEEEMNDGKTSSFDLACQISNLKTLERQVSDSGWWFVVCILLICCICEKTKKMKIENK